MWEKFISYLIIFSILYSDAAFTMHPDEGTPIRTHYTTPPKKTSKSPLLPLPLRDDQPQSLKDLSTIGVFPLEYESFDKEREDKQTTASNLRSKELKSSDSLSNSTSLEVSSSPENNGGLGKSDNSQSSVRKEPSSNQESTSTSRQHSSASPETQLLTLLDDKSSSPDETQRAIKDFGTFSKNNRSKLELPKGEIALKAGTVINSGMKTQNQNEDLQHQEKQKKNTPLDSGDDPDTKIHLLDEETNAIEGQKGKALSPELLPHWCTEDYEPPKEGFSTALLHPVDGQNSDELEDQDMKLTLIPQSKLGHVLEDFSEGAHNKLTYLQRQYFDGKLLDELPAWFIPKLTYLKQQLFAGKITWEEWMPTVMGLCIGIGTSYAVGTIFTAEIDYLSRYPETWPYLTEEFPLFVYAVAFTLLDAIPRNIELWKSWVSSLASRTVHMGCVALNGTLSFLPSLTTAFALITMELDSIKESDKTITQSDRDYMLAGAFFLYLDNQAFNMNMLKDIWTDVKEWAETSSSRLARSISGKILYWFPPSPEDKIQARFHQQFDIFKHLLPHMKNNQVRTVYQEIFNAEQKLKGAFPTLEENQLEVAQALLLLQYPPNLATASRIPEDLNLQIGDIETMEDMGGKTSHVRTWYDTIVDGVSYSSLIFGSPIRLMVLKFIIKEMADAIFGQFVSETGEKVLEATSWFLAATVGFPIQTAFEYKAMKNLAYDFIKHEEPNAHTSHPVARVSAKVVSAIHGLVLVSAITMLILQVCDEIIGNDWITYAPEFTWLQYITISSIICYLIPEWAVQTTAVEDSYNRKIVTGCVDIHNRYTRRVWGSEPTIDYQRDRLMRFAETGQEALNHLPSSVLFKLDEMSKGDPYAQKKE